MKQDNESSNSQMASTTLVGQDLFQLSLEAMLGEKQSPEEVRQMDEILSGKA
jgi:hypothetical protein